MDTLFIRIVGMSLKIAKGTCLDPRSTFIYYIYLLKNNERAFQKIEHIIDSLGCETCRYKSYQVLGANGLILDELDHRGRKTRKVMIIESIIK